MIDWFGGKMFRILLSIIGVMGWLLIGGPAHAQRGPLVLAAASMQGALDEAADVYSRSGRARPTLSYAASSALARQIAAGAPADLFISADEPWMDDVQKRGLLARGTRANMVGNRLVMIAPVASRARIDIRRGATIVRALGDGRLAMADPGAVPAGKYGRAALTKIGAWQGLERQIARAENVRAALALVERGAAPLGIVYATDARASKAVKVVAIFPATSHPPIRYPIARLARSREPGAEAFRRFLLGRQGQAIMTRYGFSRP